MLFRSFQSILDECLRALQQGESVDDCVARYPRRADRLRPYLDLAARVNATPQVFPRPAAQADAWSALRERTAELREGKRRRHPVRTVGYGAWLRPVAAVLAVVFALVAATGGTALAAQDAMPNSPLYRVKLATEDVHLWLVFDSESEAEILLDQSQERTREIRSMTRDGNEIPSVVLDALRNRNERAASIIAEQAQASGLRDRLRSQSLTQESLLVAVQADVKPSASDSYRQAFAGVHNSYLVGTGSFATALLSEDLSDGVQKVSGVVQRNADGTWTVGGIQVGVDTRTISGHNLVAGETAELIVGVSSNGRRQALSVTKTSSAPSPSNTIVSGQIEEVGDDHIVVAGQLIPITPETFLKLQLRVGQKVSVKLNNTDAGVVAGSVSSAGQSSAQTDTAVLALEGVIQTDLSQETKHFAVSGQTFSITAETSFDFTGGAAAQGARVQVEAIKNRDGVLEAQRITVLAAESQKNSVYLVGTFDGSRPGVWAFSGLELDSPPGNTKQPEPESLVAVDAKEAGGVLTVSSFFVIQKPGESLVRVEGTATTIEGTTWNFGFGQVRVDSTAKVSGKPVAGARAIVWGNKDQTGAIDATYVRVLDAKSVVTPSGDEAPNNGQ